jgi:hypothetical protein
MPLDPHDNVVKLTNHIGALVRDNISISFRYWKGSEAAAKLQNEDEEAHENAEQYVALLATLIRTKPFRDRWQQVGTNCCVIARHRTSSFLVYLTATTQLAPSLLTSTPRIILKDASTELFFPPPTVVPPSTTTINSVGSHLATTSKESGTSPARDQRRL